MASANPNSTLGFLLQKMHRRNNTIETLGSSDMSRSWQDQDSTRCDISDELFDRDAIELDSHEITVVVEWLEEDHTPQGIHFRAAHKSEVETLVLGHERDLSRTVPGNYPDLECSDAGEFR